MKPRKVIALVMGSLCIFGCGHKPFRVAPHDRAESINVVLNLEGTTPSIEVIINSRKGAREFVLSPVPSDATSHVFWTRLRSTFSMTLGSYDDQDPAEIRLFCFPACHFSYQAAPHGPFPLKVGPTLFPKITNVSQKLIFPIYIDMHYASPSVYSSYCQQKRHCKIMDQRKLHQQFTYWGLTFPTHTLWQGHELELILTEHAPVLPHEHLQTLQSFLEKLDDPQSLQDAFRIPSPLRLFLLPPESAQTLPIFVFSHEHTVILSKIHFDAPAVLLRALLSVSLNPDLSLPALDALLDAIWVSWATRWGILSRAQQELWLNIQRYYLAQHSLYSQWSLRYFLALQNHHDLRKAEDVNLETLASKFPFREAYLQTENSPSQSLILWSHPEIQNIIDEPNQNPIDRGKGSLWVKATPTKSFSKKKK